MSRTGPLDAARTRGAVVVGRVASVASRRFGGGDGSVIGGLVTSRVQPRALERLSAGRTVALVTGTNGKSTTAQLWPRRWPPRAGSPTTSTART